MEPAVVLRSGAKMPAMAWGTGTAWFCRTPEDLEAANNAPLQENMVDALRAGFRHLDAAEMYQNEADVGAALASFLAETGLSRDAVWITSKVANPSIAAGRVRAACLDTLRRLRGSRLDLYLVHRPFAGGPPMADTWAAMEALVEDGFVAHIGVSNFGEQDLRALLATARIKPEVNQLEYHPYLQSKPLAALCAAEGIALAAYCPLGPLSLWPGEPVDAPVAAAAAAHAGATPAGVLLAWPIAQGHAVVRASGRLRRCFGSRCTHVLLAGAGDDGHEAGARCGGAGGCTPEAQCSRSGGHRCGRRCGAAATPLLGQAAAGWLRAVAVSTCRNVDWISAAAAGLQPRLHCVW